MVFLDAGVHFLYRCYPVFPLLASVYRKPCSHVLHRTSVLDGELNSSCRYVYLVRSLVHVAFSMSLIGEKGQRQALPNSSIMIHRAFAYRERTDRILIHFIFPIEIEPSGGATGQASDIAIHAKEILRWRARLTEIYVKHCMKDAPSPPLLSPLPSMVSPERGTSKSRSKSSSTGSSATPVGGEKETVEQASARFETALERDYFMTGMIRSLRHVFVVQH